jgi:RNA-directed DNA polymerase
MHEERGWSVDADGSGSCESLDRTCLRAVLRKRGNDGSLWRLMGKWLRAGVMEHGELTHPETGVVQGGGLSPVLANIFLHHVLDEWCERAGQPRVTGRSCLTRFADDCVIGCELAADAQKSMGVLPKRLARFGRRIPPTKTTLGVFRKPKASQGAAPGNGTGEVRGFTPYWARTRRGFWVIKRSTARKRLRRTPQAVWPWWRHNRHAPLREATRALAVRRDARQLPAAGDRPSLGGEGVAGLVESAEQQECD